MAAASSSRFLATTAAAFTRFGSPLICWARINVSQSYSACQSRSVIAEEILFLAIGHHSVVSLGFDAALRANGGTIGLLKRRQRGRGRRDRRLLQVRILSALILEASTGEDLIGDRSEEHTSELQSLMRISYAVFCLKKKK